MKMASRGGQEGVLGREDSTDKGVGEERARCFGGMLIIQGSCAQGGRRGPQTGRQINSEGRGPSGLLRSVGFIL